MARELVGIITRGLFKNAAGKLAANARVYADVDTMRGDDGVVSVTHGIVPGPNGGHFYWTADTTAPDDGGVVVAKASGRTGSWRRQFSGGAVDVRWFGAQFDGVTNDTVAIQAAINWAIANDARVVLMPPGTAVIQPPAINTGYALQISGSHIELRGSGRTQTKLKFRLYDGSDPATHWPIVSGAVMRGHAIKVAGGSSYVRISALELDGGSGNTGNSQFPASVSTGDGWDITNKAVYLQENTPLNHIEIDDCHLHSFRGEMIYYGGSGLSALRVTRNELNGANGEGLSVSADGLVVSDNEIYDFAASGVECGHLAGYGVYRDNNVHDCGQQGIAIVTYSATFPGFIDILQNRVANCLGVQAAGIFVQGAINTRVIDNNIIDCYRGISVGPGINGDRIDNAEVRGNRVTAHGAHVDSMCWVNTTGTPRGLKIHDNCGMVSAAGIAAGKTFRRGINIDENGGGLFGPGCRIERNLLIGTQSVDNDADAFGRISLLTGTSDVIIASLSTKYNPSFFRATISWHVLNTTDLTVRVVWDDEDGNSQSVTLLSGSQSAGFGCAEWSAVTGPVTNVTVHAQASVANRARISASIEYKA